jgi:peptidoglycan hydrolase FlgJ
MTTAPALAVQTGTAAFDALAASPTRSAAADPKSRAHAQATDFEAVFLNSMFGSMFTAIDGEGPFGGAGSIGVWRSFLSNEFGKSFAKAGGIGIADHVYRALLSHQEARAN